MSQQEAKDEIKDYETANGTDEVKIGGRKEELLAMLLDTIKNSENLPIHVRSSFVTYLDLEGALALIYAILRELPN